MPTGKKSIGLRSRRRALRVGGMVYRHAVDVMGNVFVEFGDLFIANFEQGLLKWMFLEEADAHWSSGRSPGSLVRNVDAWNDQIWLPPAASMKRGPACTTNTAYGTGGHALELDSQPRRPERPRRHQ